MGNRRLLRVGIVGTVVAAVCCFTPALVLALGAVGLSAWLAWLDYVLLPGLLLFLTITVFAWFRLRRSGPGAKPTGQVEE